MPEPSSGPSAATIPLKTVLDLISSVTRWNILRELADGSSLMVSELADRTGVDASTISKHLATMRKAGIILNPRVRLFEIAPQYFADKEKRILDFGWCTLRLNFGT